MSFKIDKHLFAVAIGARDPKFKLTLDLDPAELIELLSFAEGILMHNKKRYTAKLDPITRLCLVIKTEGQRVADEDILEHVDEVRAAVRSVFQNNTDSLHLVGTQMSHLLNETGKRLKVDKRFKKKKGVIS